MWWGFKDISRYIWAAMFKVGTKDSRNVVVCDDSSFYLRLGWGAGFRAQNIESRFYRQQSNANIQQKNKDIVDFIDCCFECGKKSSLVSKKIF